MKKILWVISYLHLNGARYNRTRALIKHLSGEFEIHVLSLDAVENGYTDLLYQGHRVKGSEIGNWYWSPLGIPWCSLSPMEKVYHFIPKVAQKALSRFVFPCPMALHLRQYQNRLKTLLHEGQFETVILSVVPFTNYALAATVREANTSANVIIDIGDPLVGNSASSHMNTSRIRRMMRLEGGALSMADTVVVTNHETKQHYLNLYGNMIDAWDFHVIPNGTAAPQTVADNALTEGHNRDKWKLIYAGTFYPRLREPYALFEAVKSLVGKNVELSLYGPPSVFTSGGEIDGKSILNKGILSYEAVHMAYQQSDVVVFIDNAYGVQTPGKIFELIAAQKPILFIYENEESTTLELIRDYSGAVKCKNDPCSIADGISSIIDSGASFEYAFNIEPFLWKNRASEFKVLIGPTRRLRGESKRHGAENSRS